MVLQAALDAKRVKVTAGRIFRLSLPDGWLLLLGFGSLIGAAVCTTLIPHFTGSVVNKVGLQRQHSHVVYVSFMILQTPSPPLSTATTTPAPTTPPIPLTDILHPCPHAPVGSAAR